MLACDFHLIARGKFLHDLDIGSQSGTGENAFQKIVAENGIFRNAVVECALEGIDFVDALADERAFLEDILIDVRNREGIGIESVGTGESPLEQRAFGADGQAGRDARL